MQVKNAPAQLADGAPPPPRGVTRIGWWGWFVPGGIPEPVPVGTLVRGLAVLLVMAATVDALVAVFAAMVGGFLVGLAVGAFMFFLTGLELTLVAIFARRRNLAGTR